MSEAWALLPAAGSGSRFGGPVPKQYLEIEGRPLFAHALDTLLIHRRIDGAVVALAEGDTLWPGWAQRHGKPVIACTGGASRAASVRAALDALPAHVGDDALVLVHDAARPHLHAIDIDRLVNAARDCDDGALLGAPVRDTLKRSDGGTQPRVASTEPRAALWRAFTPQAFRVALLREALDAAARDGVEPTDDAMAVERLGRRPRLVEGREDNIKVTTPADLTIAQVLLARG